MSIIEQTKEALFVLFPEQAAAEAKARAEAEAEAARQDEIAAAASEMENLELPGATEPAGEAADAPEEVKSDAKSEVKKEEKEPEPEPRSNGVLVTDFGASGVHLDVLCEPDQVVDIARIMDEQGFFLESISGVDWIKEEQMEVIYDYNRYELDSPCRVVARTRIARSEPAITSIQDIHPGANWHERETHDFFGIKFEGHPYLVPLLLPEDADFHPLLKDFKP
jgi:NADH-quinone oxidoreductase subunit C